MTLLDTLTMFLAQYDDGGAAAGGAAGLIGLCFMCGLFLFVIAVIGFQIWMLVDAARRQFPGDNDKLIWILVILLGSLVGGLVYYFVGRPKGTLPS